MKRILCPTLGCKKLLMMDISENVSIASSSSLDFHVDEVTGEKSYGIINNDGYLDLCKSIIQVKCRGCHKKPIVYRSC